jgi:hypothetical protein
VGADTDISAYVVDTLRTCYAKGKNKFWKFYLPGNNFEPSGRTQVVVFDFDGTLTEVNSITIGKPSGLNWDIM